MAETKTTTTRGRKPKAKTEVVETTIDTNAESSNLQLELDSAKKENEALAQMIKAMQEQMSKLQEQISNQPQSNGQVIINQNDNLTRTVDVISMIGNTYNMSTQPYGGGKVYTFNKFGERKSIRFADMQDILVNQLDQFEKGYALLTNKKDYEDLGIGYVYDEVLSKEKVERLVLLKDSDAIDTILGLDEEYQEKLVGVIAQNIVNGYSYDYNKIKELEDNGIEINTIVELLSASK